MRGLIRILAWFDRGFMVRRWRRNDRRRRKAFHKEHQQVITHVRLPSPEVSARLTDVEAILRRRYPEFRIEEERP